MVIIFYDGGKLTCNEIEFGDRVIIADGCRIIPMVEVLRIIAE